MNGMNCAASSLAALIVGLVVAFLVTTLFVGGLLWSYFIRRPCGRCGFVLYDDLLEKAKAAKARQEAAAEIKRRWKS